MQSKQYIQHLNHTLYDVGVQAGLWSKPNMAEPKQQWDMSPGMHPAFPSSELLLICCHHLNLEVILEVLEEGILLKQAGPADFASPAQELITNGDPPSELILHTAAPSLLSHYICHGSAAIGAHC